VALLGVLGLGGALRAQPEPIHRYSFNQAAGDATGEILEDSIGGADGIVLGAGGTFTGTGLRLPGGSSATQAYGDLPNNLMSSLTDITFECWASVDGSQNWARIWDFGSSNFMEVPGPGGGGEGRDYFTLTFSRGADNNTQRLEIRNEDPGGGGITTLDTNLPTTLGQIYHHVVTYDGTGAGGNVVYYRDGVQQVAGPTGINLSALNDVNNWLGRSNWTGDANTQGTFDEFRIYDVALTPAEVSASFAAGPDVVYETPIEVPTLSEWGYIGLAALFLALGGSVLAARRRRLAALPAFPRGA
jgi:hypothetical protein